MNARSWNIVLASAFCHMRNAIQIRKLQLWEIKRKKKKSSQTLCSIFLTFECDIQSRHFCVKVCFTHLSSVHTVAWLAMAGSQPCWKDSFQLIMSGQRKPPTSFTTWRGPVRLGRLPVTDGWLGQRLTSVSSFGSIGRAFSRWILSEPDSQPLTVSLWSSCTVATIGSICCTTEMCHSVAVHLLLAGANPSPMSFPLTVTLRFYHFNLLPAIMAMSCSLE